MNVLIAGMPFATWHTPVTLFASRRGHEVRVLAAEGAADVRLDPTGRAPRVAPHYTFGPRDTAAEVVARVSRDWTPDLLLCWCPEMFPPPRAVEHCPIKTAAAVSDWNIYYPQLEHNMARYDVVLTDKLGAQSLKLSGARPQYFFPLYSHRTPTQRRLDVEKDIDIAFAGNLNHAIHVERGRYLERVAALSDRYRVAIKTNVYEDEYAQLLNRARIAFNFTLRNEMNLRCFEALACNTLLFVEADNLEVRDYLEDGRDMVCYTPDDLEDKLVYYLEHPDACARITAAGHAKAEALAGENRLDALLDWLAAQPRGARRFTGLAPVRKDYADLIETMGSLVPKQRAAGARDALESLSRYGGRAEFLTAAGCAALGQSSALPPADAQSLLDQALTCFKEACAAAPECAAVWHNLAYVCRNSNQRDGEKSSLEYVLRSRSKAHASLLLGAFSDAYYVRWRRALAQRKHRVEILWAAAKARLAQIAFEEGRFETARAWAQESLAWLPGMVLPYRVWAAAASRMGQFEEAARTLEQSLPFGAFERDIRFDLVLLWKDLGRLDEARALAEQSARIFAAYEAEDPSRAVRTAEEFRALVPPS